MSSIDFFEHILISKINHKYVAFADDTGERKWKVASCLTDLGSRISRLAVGVHNRAKVPDSQRSLQSECH